MREYINDRSNNIGTSETDAQRVQTLAINTVKNISQFRINVHGNDVKLETETQLSAVESMYSRIQTANNTVFLDDYNHEWACKMYEQLKRAPNGSQVHSFYTEKVTLDHADPNIRDSSDGSMSFLKERYKLSRVLTQLRT